MNRTQQNATVIQMPSNSAKQAPVSTPFELNVNHSNRPLAIQLDARHMASIHEHSRSAGELIQQELNLWRQALGPRKVVNLELHYADNYLEPYEITGLIHRLASEFKLERPVYRVVIQPEDARPSVLALLKGLGFQQCQFTIEHAQSTSLDKLNKPLEDARAFQFDSLGVQLLHSEGVENLTDTINLLKTRYQPDYIFIGGTTHKLTLADIERQHTLFEDDLSEHRTDYIGLGPESSSEIDGRSYSNLCSAKRYKEAVNALHLPLSGSGNTST